MGGANGDALVRDFFLCLKAVGDFVADGGGDAEAVDCDEDDGIFVRRGLNCHCAGENVFADAGGFGEAAGEAAEADGGFRRDIDAGEADVVFGWS